MKQALGFFVIMAMMLPGCAKKSSSKKVDQADNESYIIIKDHRARGVHKKAQQGLTDRKEHAHKKVHHVKKASKEYYKKHTSRRVKNSLKNS